MVSTAARSWVGFKSAQRITKEGNVVKMKARFSLLGMFTTVLIVALVLSLYLTRSRLATLEAEVQRLHKEVGHLTIDDAKMVHVVSVPTTSRMTWRWRVYLPAGHDFGLNSHRGELDSRGYPSKGALSGSRIGGLSNPNEPREILLDVVLGKSIEGGSCLWISENGKLAASVHFGAELPSWADGSRMYSDKVMGEGSIATADVANPLGLIAINGIGPQPEPCKDAVLIWIGKYEQTARQSFLDRGILPPTRP